MTDGGGVFNIQPVPSNCGLCFSDLDGEKGALVGGLHLCSACNLGSFRDRLDFRGFHFAEKVDLTTSLAAPMAPFGSFGMTDSNSGGLVASQVTMARTLPLKAKFFPEKEGGGLLSLFRRELQVGDDLFDKAVYVESKRDEQTAKLLSHSGLQSAIMEVVFDTGMLVVDGQIVRTQRRYSAEEKPTDPSVIRRNVAVVAHYLDLFCQHRQRPQEVAWP